MERVLRSQRFGRFQVQRRTGVCVFAKRRRGHDAVARLSEPPSPMWAPDVADVRDRRAAELRRTRHSPARHDKLAFAVRANADERRHLVGKMSGNSGRLPVRSCRARNQSRIAV